MNNYVNNPFMHRGSTNPDLDYEYMNAVGQKYKSSIEQHQQRLRGLGQSARFAGAEFRELSYAIDELANAFSILSENDREIHHTTYSVAQSQNEINARVSTLEEVVEQRLSMIRSALDILANLIPNPSKEIQAVITIAKQLSL